MYYVQPFGCKWTIIAIDANIFMVTIINNNTNYQIPRPNSIKQCCNNMFVGSACEINITKASTFSYFSMAKEVPQLSSPNVDFDPVNPAVTP